MARNRECQIRIPMVCNFNTETTVFAHYRLLGLSGIGKKAPSWCGAYACSSCHAVVDAGSGNFTREQLKLMLMLAEGVFRTLAILEREGQKLW